jgi:tetratricopeptide (TPR) repeat protein
MWPRIAHTLRRYSCPLTARRPNPCYQNLFTANKSSCRCLTSASSFHGITLPAGDEQNNDAELTQCRNNKSIIQEAEVVRSAEDKQKIRKTIAEVVRAELSAYSSIPNDTNNVPAEYERLLQMLNTAQSRHDNWDRIKTNVLDYTRNIMDLGDLHYKLGNMDQSQEMHMSALTQLLENAAADDDDDGGRRMIMIAQCMHALGTVHARCGEYDESLLWYEESLKRKNEIIDSKRISDDDSASVERYHFELGKTYNALAALQTMRGVIPLNEAMSLLQLAEVHQLHGHLSDDHKHDYVPGIKFNLVTQQIVEQLAPYHVQSIINIRFNAGKLLQQNAQYDDAVNAFRSALDLARLDVERMTTDNAEDHETDSQVCHPSPAERKNAVVELLVQIADCLITTQNYDDAARAYEEALKHHRKDIANETAMEAAIRNNLAHALAHIGQDKMGLEHYEASLKIKRRIAGDDHVEVAHTLMRMGAVYGGPMRDFVTALNCFKEALYIYRRNMNALTEQGLSGSNKFFGDDEAEELDSHIQNAVKNISLIEAGLMKDREDGIIKKR